MSLSLFGLSSKEKAAGNTTGTATAELLTQAKADHMRQLAQYNSNLVVNPGWATTYDQLQESAHNRVTTIHIEDTSNGSIIRIGRVTRICPTDGNLIEQIGAAWTEHRLK